VAPREHGTYGQLLFPLLTALALGRPTIAALALAVAALAALLCHEPILIVLGRRGPRAHRKDGAIARRWLATYGSSAALCAATALWLLPPANRRTLLVPIASAIVSIAWLARGRERTTAGEAIAATALASASFPVAIASGASILAATTSVAAFATGFVSATIAVRTVVSVARGACSRGGRIAAFAIVLSLFAMQIVLAALGIVSGVAVWAALPVCAVAWALALWTPSARYLRPLGWTLVGATTMTAMILIGAVR
jgi:YwiC-like protein